MNFRIFLGQTLLTGLIVGCASDGRKSLLPSWSGNSSSSTAAIGANASNTGANRVLGTAAVAPTGLAALWPKKSADQASYTSDEPDPTALSTQNKTVGSSVYVSAARIYEQRGDIPGAMAQYERALKANPKDVTAVVGIGRLHDRQGDFAKAVQRYQQAIQIDAKNALPHNDLGLCYARQGDVAKATSELQQAVKLQPDSKLYRNNLATVLVEGGREGDALQQFGAVHPPASAYYNVAVLLNQRGQTQAAATYLQQALQADPNMQAAHQLMAQVQQSAPTVEIPAAQVAANPADSRGSRWQAQQSVASQGPYATGAQEVTIPSDEVTTPSTATPYAPGSIYHLGDDEVSPTHTSQRQSRKDSPRATAKPNDKAVAAFQSEAARKKYFQGATPPQRENALPQTLELTDEIVRATPVPYKASSGDESSELLPVAAELEIVSQ